MVKLNNKVGSLFSTLFMNLVMFIVFFIFLEAGLRIVGYGYSRGRVIFESNFVKDSGKTRTILCLGDSFTYGGNVKSNQIYPYFLWKILQKDMKNNIRIVNRGYCERNSTQILSELRDNIKKFEPQVVILLVGSTERTNLIGNHPDDFKYYEYSEQNGIRGKLPNDFMSLRKKGINFLEDYIFNLRVYKMLRRIIWQIKQEFVCWNIVRSKFNNLIYAKYSKELKKYDLALFGKIAGYYFYNNDYKSAIDFLFKIAEQDPDFINLGFYHILSSAYRFQYEYDAIYILKHLDGLLSKYPKYKEDRIFMKYYKMFADKEKFDKYIDGKFISNLGEIVEICNNSNVKVYIQNFPRPFDAYNMYLEEVAGKYGVPFVDNYSVFYDLIKKNGIKKYLIDDGHCTVEGYRVMAYNIYSTLLKNNFLEK